MVESVAGIPGKRRRHQCLPAAAAVERSSGRPVGLGARRVPEAAQQDGPACHPASDAPDPEIPTTPLDRLGRALLHSYGFLRTCLDLPPYAAWRLPFHALKNGGCP